MEGRLFWLYDYKSETFLPSWVISIWHCYSIAICVFYRRSYYYSCTATSLFYGRSFLLLHCFFVLQDEGRLIYVYDSTWMHVNCAIWSAEVYEDNEGLLHDIPKAMSRGKTLVSYVLLFSSHYFCCTHLTIPSASILLHGVYILNAPLLPCSPSSL